YLAVKSNRNGNYRSTLFWLYRALKEDFVMALLRHNLYLLSIESLVKMILGSRIESGLELKQTSDSIAGTTIYAIEKRMNIHRMLPSQVYEKMRLKSLGNRAV
ncbi:MAG: glycosyltransferase family 2 protein, partial [Microcoleus sp. PH2017_03_ELD_O_A]|nr:glycosyltransferase family 2 protein [Microcoleus sp. PH2017_03_ELD_O_A]